MNYIITQNGVECWKGKASDEFDALTKYGIEIFEDEKGEKMIKEPSEVMDVKTFDRILADAKAEAEKNKEYTNNQTLKEICVDCKINYLNL